MVDTYDVFFSFLVTVEQSSLTLNVISLCESNLIVNILTLIIKGALPSFREDVYFQTICFYH